MLREVVLGIELGFKLFYCFCWSIDGSEQGVCACSDVS